MDKIKQILKTRQIIILRKANDTNFGQALQGTKEFIERKIYFFYLESLKNACKGDS